MDNREDEKLIADYLTGEEKALEILVSRHLKPVYGFIFRYVGSKQEAEDLAQETFLRAWRNLKKFNTNKNFKVWIFSIARNACFDFFKKKKTIPFSNFENEERENALLESLQDPAPLPDEIFERKDLAEFLNFNMKKLSPESRSILTLYYNDHLNFREIAEILGKSIDTVKSRHRRALIRLRKLIA